jgi:dual specificity phosphatase 12
MTKIWERLYIGGIADAEELADANPSGITTVISLCELPVESKRRGICYLHLPVTDDEPVPVHQFDRILDALYENCRWGSVLLHCSLGISRAPSMGAAFMAACGYKNIDAALNEIRKVRPFIHPSTVLVESLKEHLR